ncbi:SPFH domain-containing protein [Streptacidiphilus pinicola]|uniref:SPFH domain-containing protein n=1 Tax=Streptacidiphilus pinicola TaxID=2219663 RepID=UPI001057A88A|nr:SPFH domain-containing protein [Streptacidiphilus pinicola]
MDQPAERQVTAPWAVRRPPRSDAELRERPARGVLPGWAALLAILAAAPLALLVQARRATGLPAWVPGGQALHAGGPVIPERPAVALLALCGAVVVVAFFGLMANPLGTARVLSRWGGYRGTVRRSGLLWVNPLLKRRAIDVRIRHWRSEPIAATDREGSPITAELIIVWQVKDTARARFSVDDHGKHLAMSAESVFARTVSTLPCDSFAQPGPSLRDGQWLGGELTRLLGAEMAPVGVAVYSVQAVGLGYRPDFADSMRRRRIAELDAGTRDVIVGDAVETAALTLRQLERSEGITLDDTFRAELTRDLVTAFLSVRVSPPAAGAGAGVGVGVVGAGFAADGSADASATGPDRPSGPAAVSAAAAAVGRPAPGSAAALPDATAAWGRPAPGSVTVVPLAGQPDEAGRLSVPHRSATALSSRGRLRFGRSRVVTRGAGEQDLSATKTAPPAPRQEPAADLP